MSGSAGPGGPTTKAVDDGALLLPSDLVLCAVSGPNQGEVIDLEIGERYRVGSAPDSDLPLSDETVSRSHLELEVQHDAIEARDLGSRNGSFFQGARFDKVRIGVGARLRVGSTELVIRVRTRTGSQRDEQQFGDMFGAGDAMGRIFDSLRKLAATELTVLIQGETGTGKDLAARAIHRASGRRDGPFAVCDLAGISPTLIEGELFGHVRGAFTGADRDHAGVFERADGGTLFLDELGELPLEVQPRLLRALEASKVQRVGANDYRPVDVRVIAATNRDLLGEVKAGRFRDDLFHRIAVVKVRLPPLRERRSEIPALVRYMLGRIAPTAEVELDDRTLRALTDHDWPGNLRQLRNVLERAFALSPGDTIDASMLGLDEDAPGRDSVPPGPADVSVPFKDAKENLIDAWERDYLTTLMESCGGNVAAAARRAGLNRVHLYRLLRKHGLQSG
jgi:DNA-binding NtrC family response regulator